MRREQWARILGISKQETRALAAAELIPAVRDHRGYYRYRADQITLVGRARHARENRVISRDSQEAAKLLSVPR
jgi:DNA-binding transcriptional MerR regulator